MTHALIGSARKPSCSGALSGLSNRARKLLEGRCGMPSMAVAGLVRDVIRDEDNVATLWILRRLESAPPSQHANVIAAC